MYNVLQIDNENFLLFCLKPTHAQPSITPKTTKFEVNKNGCKIKLQTSISLQNCSLQIMMNGSFHYSCTRNAKKTFYRNEKHMKCRPELWPRLSL